MISAERKSVVPNTYQPTPKAAEIMLFCLHVVFFLVFAWWCTIIQRVWMEMQELKLLLKNRTRRKQQHNNMDIEKYTGIKILNSIAWEKKKELHGYLCFSFSFFSWESSWRKSGMLLFQSIFRNLIWASISRFAYEGRFLIIDKTTLRNPCHYMKSKFKHLDLREWENIIKRCKISTAWDF